jgi:hypothetical protein
LLFFPPKSESPLLPAIKSESDHSLANSSFAGGQTIVQLTDDFVDGQTIVQQRSTHCLASSLTDRQSTRQFGGKKSEIEIDSSIWREEIGNRNRLVDLAGSNQ